MAKHTTLKHTVLTDELFAYLTEQRTGFDDGLFDEIRKETAQFGGDAIMQIPDHQGTLMTLLTKLVAAKSALEIGTFTGSSAICIARGLPEDGRLICMDMNEEWTNVARKFWKQEGLDKKIELHLGNAMESLAKLPAGIEFDFVHIDAEKLLYDDFFEAAFPFVRSGGLFVLDNMLWAGRVVTDPQDERAVSIRRMNEKLARDPRLEAVLIEVGDGLQLVRKN